MKLLKNVLIVIALTFSTITVFAVAPVYAAGSAPAPSASQTDACAGLDQLNSNQGCSTGDAGVQKIISAVVSILSYIVGIAAVIMIVIGGFKYVTSGGDSNRISSAKTTLVYALIGLVVVALAQFLVHFVLTTATA